MCIFLKGGQVYPVPPSINSWRPCCHLNSPLMVSDGDGQVFSRE